MPAKKSPSAITVIATVPVRAMMSQRPRKYVLAGLGGSAFTPLRICTCGTFTAIFSVVLNKPYFKHKLHRRHYKYHFHFLRYHRTVCPSCNRYEKRYERPDLSERSSG